MKNKILAFALVAISAQAGAWGRHGHEIVGQTAATLVSTEPNMKFLRWYSFDFGVYNNLPDLVWKRPVTYEAERHEHYMDMEIFDRAFKEKPDIKDPFSLSRSEFEAQFPNVPRASGRALWRIRELTAELDQITKALRELPEPKGPARKALQEKWLLQAGLVGHYIADLSMPMHTSENHDRPIVKEFGLHKYFEEYCVDELFPDLFSEVHHEAKRRWPKFHKASEKKSITELVLELTRDSNTKLKVLLDLDKNDKHDDIKKSAKKFHKLIADRLVLGSLYLAELYHRHLGFQVDDDRFFYFEGMPTHIQPGEGGPRPPAPAASQEK